MASLRTRWTFPIGLFVCAAALRLVYVFALREHPRFDAPVMDAGYHLAWAKALAAGVEFEDGPFFRAPLYPLALGGILAIFGDGTLAPRIVQALLGALSAVLTYRLGARLFGALPGRIAGALVALSWVMVAFDGELLIPALLVPLLLAALERATLWDGEDHPRRAFVTGLLFGLAAITRPNVLLFMPWLFGWTVWKTRRARAAVALTLGTLVPVLPVTLHNALEGDLSLVATQGGVNLWIGNNPSSDGVTAIVPGTREGWFEGYRDAIAQAEAAEGRALKPTEVSSYYTGRTLDWIGSEPGAAAAHFAWKARLLVTNVELANNQDVDFVAHRTLPLLALSPVRWDVLFGLGVVGVIAALLARKRGAGMLAAFIGIYALTIVMFFVTSRFRVPLIPPLAIGAAYALAHIWDASKARDVRRVAALLVPAIALGGLTNLLPAGIDTSDANGLADLGRAELGRGNSAKGLEHLEAAVRANPRSVQIRMALAAAIVAAGDDPVRARRLLEEAQTFPAGAGNTELLARLLDVRIDAGEARAVVPDVRAALAREPQNGALRFVLGRALAASGKARQGLVELRALFADEPQNAGAAWTIAQIVEQLGTRSEAVAAFEQVLALEDFAGPAVTAEARARLAALRAQR